MKKAYDIGLYGDDPRVLNGSWKKLFGEEGDGHEAKGAKGAKGQKRKKGQGTLDGVVKKSKTEN